MGTRVFLGVLTISILLSGIGSVLYFLAAREGEQEEVAGWLQATAIQMAEAIASDQSLPTTMPDAPVGAIEARLASTFEALRREVDGVVGRPIIESSVRSVSVLYPTEDGQSAQVIASIVEHRFGDTWTPGPELRGGVPLGVVELAGAPRDRISVLASIRDPRLERPAVLRIESSRAYLDRLILEAAAAALFFFLLAGAYSIFFARWVSRSIAGPINGLLAGMEAVSRGDLSRQVDATTSLREFRELSDNFNLMLRGLRDREAIRKEMSQAAVVQRVLLPQQLPTIDHYDLAGQATYSSDLGGDYYDAFTIRTPAGEACVLLLADVAGHDISSSLMMSAVQAITRSVCADSRLDPFRVPEIINAHLAAHDFGGRFVSMFFAVLDPSSHTLSWINAGHEPALLWSARAGALHELRATHPPLGVLETLGPIIPSTVALEPGNVLLVCTDGVREQRDRHGQMFGIDRLKQVVAERSQEGSKEIIRAVREALDQFAGDGCIASDDLSLLVVRRTQGDISGS